MRASLVSCYFGLLLVCLAAPARTDNQGLIVLDGSLTGGAGWGEAVPSGVDPSVGSDDGIPDYLITPELGKLRGDNLFLSFLRFGVGVDEIAQFTDAGVQEPIGNIVVRVTGSEGSEIAGLIRSSIPDADFYLLNPNGVLFTKDGGIYAGETPKKSFQSFDGASVFLSTADELAFGPLGTAGAGSFRVSDLNFPWSTPDCCSGEPTEFVFAEASLEEGMTPAAIHVASETLGGGFGTGVDVGESFYVAAGEVRVSASNLVAKGGRVVLVAVGNAAVQVPVDIDDRSFDSSLAALGKEASVKVSGTIIDTYETRTSAGRIVLRGGMLEVDGATFRAVGKGENPGIDFRASGEIRVSSRSIITDMSTVNGVDGIHIDGEILELGGGSFVQSASGKISIHTPGGVTVSGGSAVRSKAGMIWIDTQGGVTVSGDSKVETILGGDISLVVGSLEISEDGVINASTESAAPAGSIDIRADSSIRLTGKGVQAYGGVKGSAGDGGAITLVAPHIEILDGAAVTATTQGEGNAGNVTIVADTLRISGKSGFDSSGVFSEAGVDLDSGSGGNVKLILRDLLSLDAGGQISAKSRGPGEAGNVTVTVAQGSLELHDAFIRAESSQDVGAEGGNVDIQVGGDVLFVASNLITESLESAGGTGESDGAGGNVTIDAKGRVELNRGSRIATDVGRTGTGGDIVIGRNIDPEGNALPSRFVLLGSSDITTTAKKGEGGNIDIFAVGYLASADSVVDASSGLGIDGVVDLNAPVVEVEGRLDPLPASYLDVSALLRDHCASRRAAGASSFTVEGRPGSPPAPGDYLPSSLVPARDEGAASFPEAAGHAASLPLRAQLTAFDPGCGSRSAGLSAGG